MTGLTGAGSDTRGQRWLDRGPLVALMVFSVVAVIGYGVFGRDPSRLQGLPPGVANFYAVSFGFFGQGQVILAGAVLALHLWRRSGWLWLPAFGAVYAISLGSELSGTAFGVPFGPYAYTGLLGVKWLDLVPVLIPLSWFFMAVPAYGLAARVLRNVRGSESSDPLGRAAVSAADRGGAAGRIFLGSLLLLSWDLVLDPAMSEATKYWVWGELGPYYGMPLMNLVGWYVTGVALMVALEWLGGRRWLSAVSTPWLAAYFGANLVLPVGMSAVSGMWGAVAAALVVLGGVGWWAWLRQRPALREASSGVGVVR